MKSRIPHLKYYFLGLFFVLSAAVTGYQLMYAIPKKKCEAAGNWWTWKDKCVVPLRLYDITGRAPAPDEGAAGSR